MKTLPSFTTIGELAVRQAYDDNNIKEYLYRIVDLDEKRNCAQPDRDPL